MKQNWNRISLKTCLITKMTSATRTTTPPPTTQETSPSKNKFESSDANECMNAWMNERMNERTNERTNEWMNWTSGLELNEDSQHHQSTSLLLLPVLYCKKRWTQLSQGITRWIDWFNSTEIKVWSSKNNMSLAILCDPFGMVKWPYQALSDLQPRDQQVTLNHLEGTLLKYILYPTRQIITNKILQSELKSGECCLETTWWIQQNQETRDIQTSPPQHHH